MKLFFALLFNLILLSIYADNLNEKISYGDSLSKIKPLEAYRFFDGLLEKEKENGHEEEQAQLLSRLGQLNLVMGNYPEAITELEKAAQFFKEMVNEQALAYQLSQLGSAFYFSEFLDHEYALNYFENAYRLYDSLGLKNTATLNLNYSAYIYWSEGNKEKALKIHQRALQIFDSLDYLRGKAIATSDIGFTLNSLNRYEEALDYNKMALKLAKELNEELVKIPVLNNIGNSFLGLEQLDSAQYYSQRSLRLAQNKMLKPRMSEALKTLHQVYAAQNNFQKAYAIHQAYKENEDSILHKDALRKLMQLESELMQAKKKFEIEQSLEKEKHLRNILLISLFSIVVVVILLWRNIIIKSSAAKKMKQSNKKLHEVNQLVKSQNHELKNDKLEEQNNEIINSINYAKRLQNAILPTESALAASLPDYGIVYLPKDIVSGDFYWIDYTDEYVFFAVADCTGHGVPGALVSVVGHNALNRCIYELKLKDPAEILNHLTEIVEQTFAKQNKVSDGMDIALCVWDKKDKITYAGAFNPLYLIRKNELIEIKGDKQPIGKYIHHDNFTSHEIQLQKGDSIYLFTDGYADQFGGERNKKLTYAQFKNYLLELNNLPTVTMSKELINRFKDWRGENEQVDDVCVLNVRF